jgi:hypothetical protein
LDQPRTRPDRLVRELAAQLPPARVGDAAGQAPVVEHSRDVEVLDHDRVVATGEVAGELVKAVAAEVRNACVRPRASRCLVCCQPAEGVRRVPLDALGPWRRASLRVDSWVRIRPSLGRITWCRSGSRRIGPVVNRHAGRVRCLPLNWGKPTLGPLRLPALESDQFFSARASASRPEL